MKSYGVTVQMKPLQKYFHMVQFILYVVLTFVSVDEILRYNHSSQTSLSVPFSLPIVYLPRDSWCKRPRFQNS